MSNESDSIGFFVYIYEYKCVYKKNQNNLCSDIFNSLYNNYSIVSHTIRYEI